MSELCGAVDVRNLTDLFTKLGKVCRENGRGHNDVTLGETVDP